MTYNRRKINTKGEKAPNGYHYMQDDSLMSDEEHEKRYGKSFIYRDIYRDIPEDCHGGVDRLTGSKSSASKSAYPVWRICALNNVSTISINGGYPPTTQNGFTPITYDPTNPWMIVSVTGNNSGWGTNAASAFLAGAISAVGSIVPGDKIELNMNFPQPGVHPVSGDNIDAAVCLGQLTGGTMSGQANYFCLEYLGLTIPPTNSSVPSTWTTTPYGGYVWSGWAITFQASVFTILKYDCCDKFYPQTTPSTWDCEITAYSSTPPYAPIYGCVQKYFPQVGQFQTEQLCIDSHCGSPPPATIQCSRCNNGAAISNIFPGTTCPPGWQPASLGNPCKPPTSPIPTGPVSG